MSACTYVRVCAGACDPVRMRLLSCTCMIMCMKYVHACDAVCAYITVPARAFVIVWYASPLQPAAAGTLRWRVQ
jgi:hypothetical protein